MIAFILFKLFDIYKSVMKYSLIWYILSEIYGLQILNLGIANSCVIIATYPR